MKKYILFSLFIIPIAAFAQDESDVVITDTTSAIVNAVLGLISVVLGGLWLTVRTKITQVKTFMETLATSLEDGNLTKAELAAIAKQAKSLFK
jgi:hypothetical protein